MQQIPRCFPDPYYKSHIPRTRMGHHPREIPAQMGTILPVASQKRREPARTALKIRHNLAFTYRLPASSISTLEGCIISTNNVRLFPIWKRNANRRPRYPRTWSMIRTAQADNSPTLMALYELPIISFLRWTIHELAFFNTVVFNITAL